jgi:Dihaem cytochrome c
MNGFAKQVFVRVLALLAAIACQPAFAADDVWQPGGASAVWKTECGSCHIAFPPALLSKDDWLLLMQQLDRHFGVNASLDAKSRDEIASFLGHYAASGWGHSSESLRITETGWFVKRHQGAFRMIARGQVKSLVDCAGCHKGSEAENP